MFWKKTCYENVTFKAISNVIDQLVAYQDPEKESEISSLACNRLAHYKCRQSESNVNVIYFGNL
jgi:hypothetical protein